MKMPISAEEGNGPAVTVMTASLPDFLRATLLDSQSNEVSFEDELFLTEQYLAIEKVRLGDRLQVETDIAPEVLSAAVPHLLLQPLVENALRHGLAPRRGGGTIKIKAKVIGQHVLLSVCDD